ncbi:hypothetical protein BV20DRAFT_952984 [Pilatotrama ljubarskyi]|nr:hypothetical protein BV20DRAFT_952984 [Pilatotrama ljubarskyi]
MPPSPQRSRPLRVPCPVVQRSKILHGLYFGTSAVEPAQAEVVTIYPPVENVLSKRFPLFEPILGTMYPIHECLVRVDGDHHIKGDFLVAFQERPDLPPNKAVSHLVPHASISSEIVIMRAGTRRFVLEMRGSSLTEPAKRAVRNFILEYIAHHARHHGKRTVPPLPAAIGFS